MPVFIGYVAAAIGSYFGGSVVVAEVAYAVLTVVVTVAANVALSKIMQALAGKPSSVTAAAGAPPSRTVTSRGTLEFRQLIYGQLRTAGYLAYFGTSGDNNKFLWFVVVLAGHQCEAIDDVWLDSRRILNSEIGGGGAVTLVTFQGASGGSKLTITKHLGTATDPVDASLTAALPEWDSSHVGYGIPYIVFQLERDDTAYPSGAPSSFFALVKGRRLYDPRLDSTNGGSGPHRFTDPSTWAWSQNWALAVRDYLAGGAVVYASGTPDKRLTLGEDDARIDDAFVIAAANSSDEAVTVPLATLAGTTDWTNGSIAVTGNGTQFTTVLLPGMTVIAPDGNVYTVWSGPIDDDNFGLTLAYAGPTSINNVTHTGASGGAISVTEPRFTADAQLSCGSTHGENVAILLSAGNGHIAYVGGKYRILAGVYMTPTVTLTQDDILGPIDVLTHDPADQVWNYVDGTFFDEFNGWAQMPFPAQQNPAYETDDGRQYPKSIDLQATRGNYRAQRLGHVILEQSRNMLTINASALSQKAMQIAEWDTFMIDIPEYGWSGQVFRCVTWSFLASGLISISARAEGPAAYADPALGEYVDPTTNNPPAFVRNPPDPPLGLQAISLLNEVSLFADSPGYFPATSFFEFWEYTSNSPFSSATLIGTSRGNRFDVAHFDSATRYYWVTVGDVNGGRSASHPSGAGVAGSALQNVYLLDNPTALFVWVHIGTLILPEGTSASFYWSSGVGFNTNVNQQSITEILIRSSNSTTAPNLSGINVINTGATASITEFKAAATGGSTSGLNQSWELYAHISAFTGGPLEAVITTAFGGSFVFDGSVSTDPGVASSTVVVGHVAAGLNPVAGSGLDALPDGTTFARALAAGLTSGVTNTAGLVANATSQIISTTTSSASSGTLIGTSQSVDLLTASGTFTGAPVGIDFSGTVEPIARGATFNSPMQIYITRDGTQIGVALVDVYTYTTSVASLGAPVNFWIMQATLTVDDTPAAGAHTYAVHFNGVAATGAGPTASVLVSNISLKVREYKK